MQVLQLKWPRCRKGYEILEIRRSALVNDWHGLDKSKELPADATVSERRLVEVRRFEGNYQLMRRYRSGG